MLKFEVKKLIKSKIIIFTILFAFFMSLFVNYRSNNVYSLNLDYPNYEEESPGHIFNGVFFSNYYKFDNKEELIKEFNESSKNYVRDSSSKLKSFLVNKKNHNFKEMYEVSKIIQEKDYNHLQTMKKILSKNDFKFDNEKDRKIFEFGVFESEYYHDNNIRFTIFDEEILSTNFVRRIIYNSNIIFGIPFIVFMIIAFYGFLSKEKDKGTINLLKMQPLNSKKILLYKLISIILNNLIYILSFFIFFLIICYIQGIHIGGFLDIYRVFHSGPEIKFIKAYKLLAMIILSFLSITILFSTIFLFINVISINKEMSLSLLIIIFGLGYTLTENISFLQTKFNPIFALDHIRTINGKVRKIINLDGSYYFNNINQSNLWYLFVFIIFSVIIFAISSRIFSKEIYITKYVSNKNNIPDSVLKFEVRKIVKNTSFFIYLTGALIFIFSLYFFKVKDNMDKINYYTGDNGYIKTFEKELKRLEDQIEYTKNDDESGALREAVKRYKRIINVQESINQAYRVGDSNKFYENQLELSLFNLDLTYNDPFLFKNGIINPFNRFETIILDKVSSKSNIQPLVRPYFFISDYQKFTSFPIENELRAKTNYLSNSSVYSNFRMLKYQKLDMLFLILVLFMVLGSYVYDKENRRNLDLIYTQPINRFGYHLTKILSQVFVIFGVYLILTLFIFLISVPIGGIGDISQPVINYLKYFEKSDFAIESDAIKTFTTIPIYLYLLKVLITIFFQTLFLTALTSLISIYTNSKSLLIILSTVIIGLGILITNYLSVNSIKLLSPFSYLFASKVADNSIVATNHIAGATYIISIFIIFIWSLLLSVIGGFIANKTEQKY